MHHLVSNILYDIILILKLDFDTVLLFKTGPNLCPLPCLLILSFLDTEQYVISACHLLLITHSCAQITTSPWNSAEQNKTTPQLTVYRNI